MPLTCPTINHKDRIVFARVEIAAQFCRFMHMTLMIIAVMDSHWREGRDENDNYFFYGLWQLCREVTGLDGHQCLTSKKLTYSDCDILHGQQVVASMAIIAIILQFFAIVLSMLGVVVFAGNSRENSFIKLGLGTVALALHIGASIASSTEMTCPVGIKAGYAAAIFYMALAFGGLGMGLTTYRALHLCLWKKREGSESATQIGRAHV